VFEELTVYCKLSTELRYPDAVYDFQDQNLSLRGFGDFGSSRANASVSERGEAEVEEIGPPDCLGSTELECSLPLPFFLTM
jgi:hypothetical protein